MRNLGKAGGHFLPYDARAVVDLKSIRKQGRKVSCINLKKFQHQNNEPLSPLPIHHCQHQSSPPPSRIESVVISSIDWKHCIEICWFGLVGSPSPLHSLRNSIPRLCPLLRVNYAIFQWCLLARGGRCIPVQANKSKFDAPRISNLSFWFGYEPCIRVDLSRAWIFEIIASRSVHCYHDDVVIYLVLGLGPLTDISSSFTSFKVMGTCAGRIGFHRGYNERLFAIVNVASLWNNGMLYLPS